VRSNGTFATPGFWFDIVYEISSGLGTPQQNFWFGAETGSKQLFVFDESYDNPFPGQRLYTPGDSSTSVYLDDKFQSTTGGYAVTGKTYIDLLFAEESGWNQTFGSVSSLPNWGNGKYYFPYHGVCGFGWDPFGDLTPRVDAAPILNVAKALRLKAPSFGLWVGTNQGAFGFFEQSPVRPFYVPFVQSPLGLPVFNIDGFGFADYKDREVTLAIVDMGYSVIALPAAQYRVVYSTLQPDYDWETGLYTVDCGDQTVRPSKLVFTIGGKEWGVRHRFYIRDLNADDERCIFTVTQSVEESPLYHLGLPFVHAFMTTWDGHGNQMGFEKNTHI